MHVKPAYDRHQDLLELLQLLTDASIIKRLSRGGPQHISSFGYTRAGTSAPVQVAAEECNRQIDTVNQDFGEANDRRAIDLTGKPTSDFWRLPV